MLTIPRIHLFSITDWIPNSVGAFELHQPSSGYHEVTVGV